MMTALSSNEWRWGRTYKVGDYGCTNHSWNSPVSIAHLGQWWPSAEEPSPLAGEGGLRAKRAVRVRGSTESCETPHPVCSLREQTTLSRKGRGFPGAMPI